MNIQAIIFNIAQALPGLLLAIVVHEAAHAWMAKRFGDRTAEMAGRLSLNPAVHYDPIGTVVFPLMGAVLGWGIFGWAKPVPVDYRNFREIKKGIFWVSFAGPLSNFILGTISALLVAIMLTQVPTSFSYYTIVLAMLQYSVLINFVLGGFNLIPLPPLDGSKMLSVVLKGEALRKYEAIAAYTPMIFLASFALSFAGIHTIGYLLAPFQYAARLIVYFFYALMSGF
jgi:Zn-dependent protease